MADKPPKPPPPPSTGDNILIFLQSYSLLIIIYIDVVMFYYVINTPFNEFIRGGFLASFVCLFSIFIYHLYYFLLSRYYSISFNTFDNSTTGTYVIRVIKLFSLIVSIILFTIGLAIRIRTGK